MKKNPKRHFLPCRIGSDHAAALAALGRQLGTRYKSEVVRLALREAAERRGVWPEAEAQK